MDLLEAMRLAQNGRAQAPVSFDVAPEPSAAPRQRSEDRTVAPAWGAEDEPEVELDLIVPRLSAHEWHEYVSCVAREMAERTGVKLDAFKPVPAKWHRLAEIAVSAVSSVDCARVVNAMRSRAVQPEVNRLLAEEHGARRLAERVEQEVLGGRRADRAAA